MNMMNKCAKFHKDSPSGKKVKFNLPSNFRRRPILCTTLYRNLKQAGNFGSAFDQLFFWIFLWNFHRRCLSTSSIPWCKKSKMTKTQIKGGVLSFDCTIVNWRCFFFFVCARSATPSSAPAVSATPRLKSRIAEVELKTELNEIHDMDISDDESKSALDLMCAPSIWWKQQLFITITVNNYNDEEAQSGRNSAPCLQYYDNYV